MAVPALNPPPPHVQLIEDAGLGRGKMGRLLCLSVEPGEQGSGVGTQLLQRCEGFCRSQVSRVGEEGGGGRRGGCRAEGFCRSLVPAGARGGATGGGGARGSCERAPPTPPPHHTLQGCRSVCIDVAMRREELQPWLKK